MTDYSDSITTVATYQRIAAHVNRRLESILGTKLQFEAAAGAATSSFIFAPGAGRTSNDCCVHSCAFHFAGNVPTLRNVRRVRTRSPTTTRTWKA